jgi:hypothetical protein
VDRRNAPQSLLRGTQLLALAVHDPHDEAHRRVEWMPYKY